MSSLNIIIVEKNGSLKPLQIKDFKEEDLFKKCGFKKAEDFIKQVEWNVKISGIKYIINVYAKTVGRANSENKYDFPPPIDKILFYGSCAIVGKKINEEGKEVFINLTIDIWDKIYEKLFGGFESLADTAISDEQEEDELDKIPKEKKTKQGYLKDGFVIDSDDEDESDYDSEDNSLTDESTEDESDIQDNVKDYTTDIILQDIGSELSEESYDYE
jgi:hypothetical protein